MTNDASGTPHTLHDFEKWKTSLRNFEWLGRYATGATDFDCVIERRGRFFVIEAKEWHFGIRMPLGQHIALMSLCALEPFTVYLVGEVEGDERWPLRVKQYTPEMAVPAPEYGTNRPFFRPFEFDRYTKDELGRLVELWGERVG